MTPPRLVAVCLGSILALLSACRSTEPVRDPLDELGSHRRAVRTGSAEAQQCFDRGLVLAYAFNHDEAIRWFERALEHDPNLAIAWWGIALCNGPHINNPVVDDVHGERAWLALQKARELALHAAPREQALILALERRYAWPNPADRRALDVAYARAMQELWRTHPDDADIGALCAEALMDLSPWNQWSRDGQPKEGTLEVLAILDRVIQLEPGHPLAHHLKIHALEASPNPAAAVPSADALRTLVPGAGHLVHMPAHIYARVGRWEDCSKSNAAAAEVDGRYRALHPEQGFYRIYMAHNDHFLAFSRMMQGNFAQARAAARALIANMPRDWAQAMAPFVDGMLAIELEVLVRFGRWDEILEWPEPAEHFPVQRALRHFARASAHDVLGDRAQAEAERQAFDAAFERVPADQPIGNNLARNVLTVARDVLDGELAARRGDWNRAVEFLERAVAAEDQLAYDEPPDWILPARHALGAVLAAAGRHAHAEQVYREDLRWYPENGWSLRGLADALHAQQRGEEAAGVEERFRRAWAGSDTPIRSSCLCLKAP